jgi:hypothetical protein
MEAHGIPTDHPIITATKASADLHEAAFHAYLARAKVQQDELLAPRVLLVLASKNATILPADDQNKDTHAHCPHVIQYHTPPSSQDNVNS